ncbi:MAG: tRNA pseudouridine(55) synthase TruB [Pseudomonadota bacterium]
MARKKKGRPISGWVVVDKPAGLTSSAVVNKVKWALNAQKAGHAGTLDPAATGVLAIVLGEATKTVPFVTDALKAYRFTVRWGAETNTDDAEGEVVRSASTRPSEAAVKSALSAFIGDIEQVPPAYSAVKIDGQRAYKKAREGEDVVLDARPLWVSELILSDRPSDDLAEFEMVCGKGGYVRAIARDLGRELGCYGHVDALRRIWSGPFEAQNATPFDLFETHAHDPILDDQILPLEIGLCDLPELRTTVEGAAKLGNGNPGMVFARDVEFGVEAWASLDGRAIAVGIVRGSELHPTRVFAR